ncbi:hypothetical protein GCM10011600_11270 [Pseudolysinimonas yzui]|uniref:Uncharacterized protein n=1 Tax=Pseudolysinimonas yzui TaxID=2708254 RepID=A0A8J3M127_9MICO|nr:hypothetical protein GCM10011600_11270 [Pseudolysinimonas yzui]
MPERLDDRVRLPGAELGEPRAGRGGVEDAAHVGGRLTVTDEEDAHDPLSLEPAADAVAGKGECYRRARAYEKSPSSVSMLTQTSFSPPSGPTPLQL